MPKFVWSEPAAPEVDAVVDVDSDADPVVVFDSISSSAVADEILVTCVIPVTLVLEDSSAKVVLAVGLEKTPVYSRLVETKAEVKSEETGVEKLISVDTTEEEIGFIEATGLEEARLKGTEFENIGPVRT